VAADSSSTVAFTNGTVGQALPMRRWPARVSVPRLSFAGFRFPFDVIVVAMTGHHDI
jgi:hypothetical protein